MDQEQNKVPKSEKVGKIAYDVFHKEQRVYTTSELSDGMLKDYMDNVYQCIDTSYNKFNNQFFIIVETKKEMLLQNVIRNYFFARQSCPTPIWDQSIYRYDKEKSELEYLWTVPSKDTCQLYMNNQGFIVLEERQLLYFIKCYYDGTLLKLAKELNGEKPDSFLLAN